MLATVGLLVGMVGLCLAYKSRHERPWLLVLVLVAVMVGLALLGLPVAGQIADVLAGWLMVVAAPYALPVLLCGLLEPLAVEQILPKLAPLAAGGAAGAGRAQLLRGRCQGVGAVPQDVPLLHEPGTASVPGVVA
jgi:hypothetical protein